jgi:hypothetical protein
MSFTLTTHQVRSRTKFVTRRLGWKRLKPGDVIQACEKCMGLKKGETVVRLAMISVLNVRIEPLHMMAVHKQYGDREAALEGFPHLTGAQFVQMFVQHSGCGITEPVTRIEFEYV